MKQASTRRYRITLAVERTDTALLHGPAAHLPSVLRRRDDMPEPEILAGEETEFPSELLDHVASLRKGKPLARGKYYLLGLFADSDERPTHGWFTMWVGYSDSLPRREIRRADRVHPVESMRALAASGRPALLINKPSNFIILWLFGGFGVVEERAAEAFYPAFREPREMARDSSGLGFRSVSHLSSALLQHAPSKKLRMQVLKRDQARCVLCGRSPADNVDIQLNLHHVIPWSQGGLTERENLVTLCHTCHGGLDPHHDEFLRRFLKEGAAGQTYCEQLMQYRRALRKFLTEE